VRNEAGDVGGVLCAVIETTDKIIDERRLRLLNALAEATKAKTPAEACQIAAAHIAGSPNDVPFALLYLVDQATRLAKLVGSANIEPGTAWSPTAIRLDERAVWPLSEVEASGPRSVALEAGPQGARGAVILPIERPGDAQPYGFIVAGLSPLLSSGESYARFHRLLSASIAQSVSNAAAYEHERQRAEALAELDRAKTSFFSNVSHEFRTPLTLMLGPLSDLLSDGSLPEKAAASLDVVQRNGRRLQKLVNTLLDVARLDHGGVDGTFEAIDLSRDTRDVASMFQAAVEKAGLDFIVEVEEGVAAHVDPDNWEKIVVNLISNSLKHTFDGKIEVRLSSTPDGVVLVVRDTGVGIPEAELAHVFERFHRVRGARSRTHEGSGIGLSLVRELVRLHHGEIAAESRLDLGSTFTVRLPAARAGAAAVRSARRHSGSFDEERPALALTRPAGAVVADRSRVLVVDDNADMSQYVAGLLAQHWHVDVAKNGAEALERMRESLPEVVVSDIMMPGIDGLELLALMRADSSLSNIPVMLLSARAGQEASVAALAAGASDYVVKPFSSRELVARVAAQIAFARARAAERSANRRLHALFAEAPVSVSVVKGPDFSFELANARYEAMVGRTNLVGKPFRLAFPELERDAPVLAMLAEVRASGKAFTASEYPVMLRRDGRASLEEVFFLFTCQPIHEPDGSVDTILTIAVDVTESVRLRRELEMLANSERQARAQAEAASALKDEFLATASHELRTPLNAILGWARLLASGTLDDSAHTRGVETIERNALAQVRLIEDILDGSRIITGKLRLEVRPLDMATLVNAALDAIRPAAHAKSITLSVELDPAAARVLGDPDRIQQVIWNLAINAIKFTPKGGRVAVRLQRVDTSIELLVEDNGQGVEASFLPHIFERFRQADGSSTRRHGGLGLGLALVRHLVEAHGGSVRAESEGVGRGARFFVVLPVQAVFPELSAAEAAPTAALPGLPRAVDLSGLSVLVIDDELDARELVAVVLRSAGASVRLAASAEEAMSFVAQSQLDLLISDIGMPEVDGYQLIDRLRSRAETSAARLPAIALTAYAREQDRKRALAAGFQTHVSKPVEPAELLRIVAELAADKTARIGER
jgi:signal transduction histidine kinase/DNA-binding response OmpR family regulator